MEQAKIAYDKCKKKMPNRPPDEIDFGLGFRAALRWSLTQEIVKSLLGGSKHRYIDSMVIRKELNEAEKT
jgi:hypothetical protein